MGHAEGAVSMIGAAPICRLARQRGPRRVTQLSRKIDTRLQRLNRLLVLILGASP